MPDEDEDEDEDEAGDEAGPAACTCCVGRYYTHNLHSLNERNRNHFCFIIIFFFADSDAAQACNARTERSIIT